MKEFKDFFVKFPEGIDGKEKYAIDVLTIRGMFSHKNQFIIPTYQRPYSWTKKEVEELIKDVDKTIDESKKWFCGPIFTSQDNFQDNIHYLLDGQQRMTTIFLILRCIWKVEYLISRDGFDNLAWDRRSEKGDKERITKVYARYNNLQKLIEQILIITNFTEFGEQIHESRFQTENSIREKFNSFIVSSIEVKRDNFENFQFLKASSEDKYAPTLINLNLNLNYIYKYLKGVLESVDGLEKICELGFQIINNLMFIKIPLFKKGDVLDIFETLNSRGKSLALTDLIRFKTLKNLDEIKSEKVEKKWADIFFYSGLISSRFGFFKDTDVFIERFINSFSDESDGVKNDKDRIFHFDEKFQNDYIVGVDKMLHSLKGWYSIFDLENGIINNFNDKNQYRSLIELLAISLKINVNSQVAFISYLTNQLNLDLFESDKKYIGGLVYEIFQFVLTTFSLTTFHNVRSNSTRRIFIEIAKSFRPISKVKLWYSNFNSKLLIDPKSLGFESNFFPSDNYKVSSNSFSGIQNIILSKSNENSESTYILSLYHFIVGGTFPNREDFKNSHLDHIMPQRWFNNSCWIKQNNNGETDLKNAIEKMNDSKIKDVLSSLLEQGDLWSDTTFSNSFVQLIGNKFQIISKTNIEKGNNFWGDCEM